MNRVYSGESLKWIRYRWPAFGAYGSYIWSTRWWWKLVPVGTIVPLGGDIQSRQHILLTPGHIVMRYYRYYLHRIIYTSCTPNHGVIHTLQTCSHWKQNHISTRSFLGEEMFNFWLSKMLCGPNLLTRSTYDKTMTHNIAGSWWREFILPYLW